MPFVWITEDYGSPAGRNGPLMSSYLTKPPSKGLPWKQGLWRAKEWGTFAPPLPVASTSGHVPMPRSPLSPAPSPSPHCTPFPSALFLAVPSGEEGIFVPTASRALGRPREGSVAGWPPQEARLWSPERVRGKEPSEATSRRESKPSIQTTPRGTRNATWAALPLPLTHYCLCIVYILYIYISKDV